MYLLGSLISILTSALIFAAFPAYSAKFPEQKTETQYWAETGLNFSFVAQYFEKNCRKNSVHLVGCLRGLNILAALAKPAMTLVFTGEDLEDHSELGDLLKSYDNNIHLYSLNKSKEQDLGNTNHSQNVKTLWNRQLKYGQIAHKTFPSGSLQFAKILNDLKIRIPEATLKNREAWISGSILNTYFSSSRGAHDALVPYNQLMDSYRRSTSVVQAGIGAILSEDEPHMILSVYPKMSAELAGIKAGDVLYRIEGTEVAKLNRTEIRKKIVGSEGTSVLVEVLRNQEIKSFSIRRRNFETPGLTTKILKNLDVPYGYIRVRDFNEGGLCQKIGNEISRRMRGVKGLVLDLQGNPGGLLYEGRCVATLFLGQKLIVAQKNLVSGKSQQIYGEFPAMTNLPLVVLIDASTGSVAETVAGAIQSYQRGWLLGETSFGKATIQEGEPWLLSSLFFYETKSRTDLPSGRSFQKIGITPDFVFRSMRPLPLDEVPLREADYYPNALNAVSLPWKQPRPERVSLLGNCLANAQLEKLYEIKKRQGDPQDMRQMTAEAILKCESQNTPPKNTLRSSVKPPRRT